MPDISNEQIRDFDSEFRACMVRVGGGKVAIDSDRLRALVRKVPEVTRRIVELHCMAAAAQPGLVQPAMIIATAYQVEWGDDSLVRLVSDRALELDVGEDLATIRFAPTAEAAQKHYTDSPERKRAEAWWAQDPDRTAVCDHCNEPVPRGMGYLIDGRSVGIGDRVVHLGEELLCTRCFDRHAAGLPPRG